MNLRPIETMGLERVVESLGLAEVGPALWLSERMPWPPKGDVRMPALPGDALLLADPLSLYFFVRPSRQGLPSGALGIGIFAPLGDTIDGGFMFQRFLVWMQGSEVMASPQGPAVLTSSGDEVESVTSLRADGPEGVSAGLEPDVVHAVAGLIETLRQGGAA